MLMQQTNEWFGEWFDSPYYHILYKNRDYKEAQLFLDELCAFLEINDKHKIMDLACGKGRHSLYLNSKGCNVTGLDLSEHNIEHAKQFENEHLHFYVHDMREVWHDNSFDFVLNIFTSFGYFETKEEHQNAISAAAQSLKKGGKFVLDFLNPYKVIYQLVPKEKKIIDGITFNIHKYIDNDYIIKDIEFEDQGKTYNYKEKVRAIRRSEFYEYFEKANLQVLNVFGDYLLNPYIAESSDRMIFILEK